MLKNTSPTWKNFDTDQNRVNGIDPAPRIVLDPEIGMLAAGFTATDAQIAAYHHTIPVLCRAEDHLGGYKALSAEVVRCRILGFRTGKLLKAENLPNLMEQWHLLQVLHPE